MKTRVSTLAARAAIFLAVALAAGARAEPARPANAVRAIEVGGGADAVELRIRGSRPPSYTVFKLQDPPRLVLDLAGADVEAVSAPIDVAKGGVKGVTTAQYRDERAVVGRVIVALEQGARYEVAPAGDDLVVQVSAGAAQPAAPAVSAPVALPKAPAAAKAAPAAPADNVLSRRTDEAPAARPATAVTGVRARAGGAFVALDGDVAKIEVLELANPPRLAVDLHGVAKAPRSAVALDGAFRQARFGRSEGKVRVVLDLAAGAAAVDVKRVAGGLAIAPRATATAAATPAPAAKASAGKAAAIADVRFHENGGTARIEVVGRAPWRVERPDARTLVLTLDGAKLPPKLERSLDTSGFAGPVTMVSTFNQPSTNSVKVVASIRGEAHDEVVETSNGLSWTLLPGVAGKHDAAEPVALQGAPKVAVAEPAAAGYTAEAPSLAASSAPQRREYTGRRITLDFHDIEIRNLLRLIADVSKKNVVVADDVQGKVSVSLRNVPWDQALDIVLRTKGLDKEEMGNIIRVARAEDIAKEQEARLKAAAARIPLVPLKVRLIPVNFAKAAEMADRVKGVLSERGSVIVDDRTNILIVKDMQDALSRAEALVRNLDTEVPQVRIESRIVEASSNFQRAIGVQWGGNATFSPATGNPTGLLFPNIANTAGAAGGGPTTGTAPSPNYAVNLPAPIGQGNGGGIGFAFGSAGGQFNLNLRLSALENTGVVKTISAPSVSTIDNREATIAQGVAIPFAQVNDKGQITTLFIEAKLELKVTPHVSSDGSILMKIKVTNNLPNPQLTGSGGQPSISKREAETEALVKDGETTVIGGIYTRQTANRQSSVPGLGRLPILGYFFRSKTNIDDHTELLIFITPRVLNKAPATVAQGT
jgi:type IV pilus assembly protein PilQ